MKEYDEFSLIGMIDFPLYRPEYVDVTIGDDCAVMPFNDEYLQVISCDLLTEGVHFIRETITPQQLGYKSVAASLSDIAAMGGIPTNILISIALPKDYQLSEWQGFYTGVAEICEKYHVNLIGGDTTSSQSGLTINVTAMGVVKKDCLHLRSDAQPGDLVFVTSPLGGSRAGLECILRTNYLAGQPEREKVLTQHFHPEPCCQEIIVLNEIFGENFHALNDISDGLISECYEIAEASKVAIVLEENKVPVFLGATLEYALTGGEDYQLVGTVAPEKALELAEKYEQKMGKPLYFVGTVCAGEGVHFLHEGRWQVATARGYNHFAAEEPQQQSLFQDFDEQKQYILTLEEENQQLLEIIEQQRCFRHDLSNHLSCISGLIDLGDNAKAKEYLHHIGSMGKSKKPQYYSKRSILNVLFNQKAALAEALNIDFDVFLDEIDLAFIEDYDICTLLGNLLDNGLESAQKAEDGYLVFDLQRDRQGNIALNMRNSCVEAPVIVDGQFVSRKKDAILHGKGMKNIQRVAQKYQGDFSYFYYEQEKSFHTHIIFRKTS